MTKLFGTDGIRTIAGEYPLDPRSIRILGGALIGLLIEEGLPPRVLIGRDTRESGAWMEEALVQGINRGRGEAVSAGIVPTSAVSYLTAKKGFSAGVVISASHNPYLDNGIKIFSSRGVKIADSWEEKLERALKLGGRKGHGRKIRVRPDPACIEDYAEFLKGRLAGNSPPRDLKIIVDCSNGAGSFIAPDVFRELGFEVTAIHNIPDGRNINQGCGSLHPESLARKVVEAKASIGIAFDGDADRAVWVDETGRILNGDHTLYVTALFMKDKGRLRSGTVVATTMTNMGLESALKRAGLSLLRTRVGDKYVYEGLVASGANLGGERSGHTIFLDDCPTGDGILTSLRMLEAMIGRDLPLSELVRDYIEYPQVLINVRVARKADFNEFPEIADALEAARGELGETGRLDLRYSGTEPLARIMVEGPDQEQIERCGRGLAEVVRRSLGES